MERKRIPLEWKRTWAGKKDPELELFYEKCCPF